MEMRCHRIGIFVSLDILWLPAHRHRELKDCRWVQEEMKGKMEIVVVFAE